MLNPSNNTRLYASEYSYDNNNNVNKIGVIAGNTGVSMTYTYGTDNLPSTYTANTNTGTYTYDKLNRLESKTSSISPTVEYDYYSGTSMVQQESYGGNMSAYNYDANGNIGSITDGTKTIFYKYDELNRIIAECDENNQGTVL